MEVLRSLKYPWFISMYLCWNNGISYFRSAFILEILYVIMLLLNSQKLTLCCWIWLCNESLFLSSAKKKVICQENVQIVEVVVGTAVLWPATRYVLISNVWDFGIYMNMLKIFAPLVEVWIYLLNFLIILCLKVITGSLSPLLSVTQ